jgi:hypothetical protein
MRKNNIPLTRENYLLHAYGDPNHDVDAEGEADLPPEIRKPLA